MIARMAEIMAVMLIYFLIFVLFIGPMVGVGEPLLQMIWEADHRVGWSTNIRSWIFIFSCAIFVTIYCHIKPRLFGVDPEEYWSVEVDDGKDGE